MKTKLPGFERWGGDRILFLLLAGAVVVGAANAVCRYPSAWDFFSYHLSAALQKYDATTFQPYDYLQDTIEGHPPAAHFAMGALVIGFGRVSAATLLGSLSFLIWLGGYAWLTRDLRRTAWLGAAALMVPLIAIHLYVPYIDLWTGAWLALAVYASVRSQPHGPGRREAIVFFLGSSLAALSKFQAWPPLAALWLWTACQWLHAAWIRRVVPKRRVLLTLLATAVVIGLWPLRNTVRFGNPTHPWTSPVTQFLPHHGPKPLRPPDDNQNVAPYLTSFPPALQFACSVLELGRFDQPTVPYSYDMWSDWGPYRPHHRAGGWGIWTVLIVGGWWAHWWSRDRRARSALALLLLLTLSVAVLPLSLNLRYWLFLPLSALACLVTYDNAFVRVRPWLIVAGLVACVLSCKQPLTAPGVSSQDELIPPAARRFWQQARRDVRYCPPSVIGAIFWAGPDLNTFHFGPGGQPMPPDPEAKP